MTDHKLRMRAKTDEELVQMLNDNLEVMNVVAPTIATMAGTYDEQIARRIMVNRAIQTVSAVVLEQYCRNNNATDR